MDPGERDLCKRAHEALRLGRLTESAQLYRQAVVAAPNDWKVWNNLGVVLERTRDYEAALDAYKSAVSLSNPGTGPVGNYCNCLRLAGRLSEASQEYEKLARAGELGLKEALGYGLTLASTSQLSNAEIWVSSAERMASNDSDLSKATLVHGRVLDKLGRCYDALQCYQAIIAREPGRVDATKAAAKLLIKDGRCGEAIEALRHSVRIAWDNPSQLTAIGLLLSDAGNDEEGLAACRRAA